MFFHVKESDITFSYNRLKGLKSAERGSKIIGPNVPPINNSSEKKLARREALTFDQVEGLSPTYKIKTKTTDALQGNDCPAIEGKRNGL